MKYLSTLFLVKMTVQLVQTFVVRKMSDVYSRLTGFRNFLNLELNILTRSLTYTWTSTYYTRIMVIIIDVDNHKGI